MTTYRVLVSTDLGGDPDDIQSLYRLIHYSDVLRVEGLGSCTGPGSVNSAELISEWIRRVDVEHLRRSDHPELMTEAELMAGVVQGATRPGAPGPGRTTPASLRIVERALAGAPPLWVLVWGSLTDLAQALFDAPEIAPRIRVNSIGSSNTVHDPASRDWLYRFMAERCPALWWIEDGVLPKGSRDTFRGVYLGGEQTGEWNSRGFVELNIRGRGSTHGGQFPEKCGDAFPLAPLKTGILKEGDSPTMLHLLSPVFGTVGNVDDPSVPSWGGSFRRPDQDRFPNYWTDLDAPPEVCQATISRWRAEQLAHWKARWERY